MPCDLPRRRPIHSLCLINRHRLVLSRLEATVSVVHTKQRLPMTQTESPASPSLTILHTSDWHLGHELNGQVRETEHQRFLDWLLDAIGNAGANVLLVTGDVYDVANPPVSAMRRLFAFLNLACVRYPQLQVVILGGNHDSAMRIDLPAALLGEGRVHFIGNLPRREGEPDFERILIPLMANDQTAAWLAAVPYCRPSDLGSHTLPTLYGAVQEAGFAKAGDLPLIVTGHLHVAGGSISELSERRIVVGGEEAEATSLFDPRVAYVALGHLHRPQDIAAPTRVRYAGSPFPLSSTERTYIHSVSVVRLGGGADGKACEIEALPIPRPVAFLAVGPCPLDEAVQALEELDHDPMLPSELWPFIEVTVTVTGPEPGLNTRILAALEGKPLRLVRLVRRLASSEDEIPLEATALDLEDLKPEAIFAQLYAQKYAGAAPPDDLADSFVRLLVETETLGEVK